MEKLDELQLIVQVPLEPQDDLIVVCKAHQCRVALGEVFPESSGVAEPWLARKSARTLLSEVSGSSGTGPSWRTSRQVSTSPAMPEARMRLPAESPLVM